MIGVSAAQPCAAGKPPVGRIHQPQNKGFDGFVGFVT